MRLRHLTAASAAVLLAGLALLAPTSVLAATTSEGCLPGVIKSRLSQVRSRFGKISVVSTHRPGATIRGTGKPSYHGACRAVDFVPPPGKYSAVTRWLYANHEGGIGTYTCMNHIHLDNGPSVRWSKCR